MQPSKTFPDLIDALNHEEETNEKSMKSHQSKLQETELGQFVTDTQQDGPFQYCAMCLCHDQRSKSLSNAEAIQG